MATTRRYINHLLQNIGITPACSEEERAAADDIARIFSKHGFEPEIQEFSASGSSKIVTAVLGIAVFLGAVLVGIGGVIGVIGLLLAIAAAVLFTMERAGRPVLSGIGTGGLSQNVIAYHQASGPLASPRNRPVVVVAHYDSPRADIFSRMPYASYRPLIAKLLPVAMLVPGIVAILRLFPFPDAVKVVLWLLAIVAALVPLANAVAIILNRFVLPYTSGSVCNKSSVAAMLGVMNAVTPFQGENEFPGDVPFEEYFAEQRRAADEAMRAAYGVEEMEAPVEPAPQEGKKRKRKRPAGAKRAEQEAPAVEVPSADSTAAIPPVAVSGETASMPAVADDSTQAMSGAAIAAAAEVVSDAQGVVEAAAVVEDVVEGVADAVAGEEPDAEMPAASVEPLDVLVVEADEDEVAVAEAQEPVAEVAEEAPAPEEPTYRNAQGNFRFGEQAIRALGMLPATCVIEYEAPEEPEPVAQPAPAEVETPVEASVAPVVETPEPAPAVFDDESEEYDEDVYEEDEYDDEDSYEDDDEYDEYDEDDVEGDEEWDDEEYDDFTSDSYRSSYESRGLSFGPRGGVPRPRGGFAETLTAVGEGAARFFSNAFHRGKDAIEEFKESHAGAFSRGEAEEGEFEDEAYASSDMGDETISSSDEPAEMDKTETFESLADRTMEATAVVAPQPETIPVDDTIARLDRDVIAARAEAETAEMIEAEEPTTSESAERMDAEEPALAASAIDALANENESTVVTDAAPAVTESTTEAPTSAPVREAPVVDPGATVAQQRPAVSEPVSEPRRPVETVDSLMAEISARHPVPAPREVPTVNPAPAPARRVPTVVPDPAQPSLTQPATTSRASLFDLPDPSVIPTDPFAPSEENAQGAAAQSERPAAPSPSISRGGFTVISTPAPAAPEPAAPAPEALGTISADAPVASGPQPHEKKRRGRGLFGRKKREEQSMSEFLGVDDDFDAKNSGRSIGSWDNFEDDDWKGGATGIESVSATELRDAITSMGDDELLGHDIWFVATGASEYDQAGMKAFLQTHRDKLRGVFLINLECVGAGQVAMLATEGEKRVLKGDKRIMNLVRKVSSAFHNEYGSVDMPYVTTDAYAAMSMSLRSLTLAGIDGPSIACSHSEEDVPYNVDVDNIDRVADVVTEVIRRS